MAVIWASKAENSSKLGEMISGATSGAKGAIGKFVPSMKKKEKSDSESEFHDLG